ISHRATNRVIFVNGALKAADYLIKQSAGMYGMKDLIG
ncbi:MAG: 4-hydroxy-tetrahydrodipicolinate reductase, partial [Solobacterium sp.]|nr:4-hydroxy-tetrahydrodipicolinate reductase [Solobacterium sp.]